VIRRAASVATAIALTAAATVVAMASRAPLSRSTPIDAGSARAPVAALSTLLLGCATVVLATLVALVWPARRRGRDREPEFVPPPFRVHWLWKLLAVALPIALGATLVAAALVGTATLGRPQRPPTSVVTSAPATTTPSSRGSSHSAFVLPSWLPWIASAIIVVAIATLLLLVIRRRSERAEESADVKAVRSAATAAIGALEATADPRGAIIAAYGAMLGAFAAHGLPRSPEEAPREYLHRVLTAGDATEREASTLTGLFEEARFSRHPVSEHARDVALGALSALRMRLRSTATA
jgi:heme/copper-type cytochrome/quinol oxidase subunit 2